AKREKYERVLKEREARIAELVKAMEKIEDAAIKKMPAEDQRAAEGVDRPQVVRKLKDFFTPEQAEEYGALKKEREALKKKPEPAERGLALSVNHCMPPPPPTHVLTRGNAHAPAAVVSPGFPAVLGTPDPVIPEPGKDARGSGRRTALANWIASKDN